MPTKSVATGSALLLLVAVASWTPSVGEAPSAQEESRPKPAAPREAVLNWNLKDGTLGPYVVPLAEETEGLSALKKRSKVFLRLLFGESVLPKGAEDQLLAVSSDADHMYLPAFEHEGLVVMYAEGYEELMLAVTRTGGKPFDLTEPGHLALATARTLFLRPGGSIRDISNEGPANETHGLLWVMPIWCSPEGWQEGTGLRQWWPQYVRFEFSLGGRLFLYLPKPYDYKVEGDRFRNWFSLPLAADSGGIRGGRTESRASLIARFDLAQLPWQPDPPLDQVEFFDTLEAKAALADGSFRSPEGLDRGVGEKVELTPGVQRAVQDAAILISVALAPEALPRGFAERLVPLHTETGDRMQLPRYEYQGWVVSINVTQGAVNVLAKRRDGKRTTGPEELQNMVSGLANKLFVSPESIISTLEPHGKPETYGFSSTVLLKRQKLDISQIRIVNQPSRLASLQSWPYLLLVEMDGLTARFIFARPTDSPRLPDAEADRHDYPPNQWFERLSSSRYGPTWGNMN